MLMVHKHYGILMETINSYGRYNHIMWKNVVCKGNLLDNSSCRWRMVIHGGYSRTIVYLQCSDNNRASTVFSCFRNAMLHYGLPNRVWSDRGGENVHIADFMLTHPQRGSQRGSFITGLSVPNSRTERLWRDVFQSSITISFIT